MALLHVIALLILIGVLIIAGYKMVAPLVERGKINRTKTTIQSNIDAIASWTAAHCRLPDAGATATGFINVVQNPYDAWGIQLAYLYAPELATNSSCAQICGLSSTKFFVNAVGDSVAFVIASSQYSPTFHDQLILGSKLNGATLTSATLITSAGGSVEGTLNQLVATPPDILRVVTLNELKARIGCAGYTLGRLRILNNELPNAYTDSYTSYVANLFGDGGAPAYSWTLVSGPAWLHLTSTGVFSIATLPTTGSYTVVAQVTDQNGTTVQRTYTLKVQTRTSSPSGGGDGINNDNGDAGSGTTTGTGFASNGNLIAFGLNQNNTAGCFFYPYNFPLLGKTLRAYWNFCYAGIDTSPTSSNLADGYTFALMQASNPTTYCGTGTTYNATTNPFYDCTYSGHLGEFLAYCGLPGQSIAAEFDIFPSSARNDPSSSYNHLAIVKATSTHSGPPLSGLYGDNTHGIGGNPACDGTNPACLFGTVSGHNYPATWLENDGCTTDHSTHNARVEIHTRCNSDCSQCETNSCSTNTLIKVWIDRGWLGSCSGTCDGTAITASKCTGTCNGTCDGSSITNAQCIAPAWRGLCTGTCDGTSVTSAKCVGKCTGTCDGTSITNASCINKDWYLPCTGTCDGAAITNAKCLITTAGTGKCTGTCDGSAISNAVCNKNAFINLGTNETLQADLSYCTTLPTALNQYKVGFTQATGGAVQYGYIGDFLLKSYGSCPSATIAPATLPTGTVGVPYSVTLSATGGTAPYSNWQWSASNISGITASTLPPGLSLSSSGVISGTPTTAGTYNTILVSVDDACSADTCTNTVSKSYSLTIASPPAPTCTLSANPAIVAYNGTTSFTWSITNGPASGTWSIAPGGSCSSFSSSTGGTCTSGSQTSSGTTIYTLTVSNSGGSNSCSASINTGCANYRVWNATGATTDFIVNGTCRNNVGNGGEITTSTNRLLPPGTTSITRLSNSGTCGGTIQGAITYNQAMQADITANGGDGDCQVYYSTGDTVTDR